jgi:hypothetical protein
VIIARRLLWRLGCVLAGLAVVAWLLHALGPSRVAGYLVKLGPGFLFVLAAYGAAMVLYSLPFGMVLPETARPSVWGLLASRNAAVAVNAATPFLGLGGEPVRLLWIDPTRRSDGVAGIAVDRAAFFAASAIFLVFGAIAGVAIVPLPRWVAISFLAIAGLILGGAIALYFIQRHSGALQPLARLVRLIAPKRGARLVELAASVDAQIRTLHEERPGRFSLAIATHFAGRITAVLEVLVAARLLGVHLSPTGAFLFCALPLAMDVFFSMIPSQIGLNEGAGALVAGALGLDPAAGVAIAFVQRLRQVAFVSLGFGLLSARRSR